MEIDAFLCDHAEVAEGKLFVNGAGINIIWSGPQAPHGMNVSVAIVIQVPWTATNQAHELLVSLIDDQGTPAQAWTSDGSTLPPVELRAGFNMGRPPQLPVGETQSLPFAFNFNVPLSSLGLYEFVISLDGTEMKRLPIRAMVMQQPVYGG